MSNLFRYGRTVKSVLRIRATIGSFSPEVKCTQCRTYSHVTKDLAASFRSTVGCPFSTLTAKRSRLHPAAAYATTNDDSDIEKSYHKVRYSIPKHVYPMSNYKFADSTTSVFLIRSFHTNSPNCVNESNVEKTVKVLKDLRPESENKIRLVPAEQYFKRQKVAVQTKRTLLQRFGDELKHYYHGFRLLFIDIKISARLIWVLMKGESLSRRERKQLVRTSSDLFRLVPFLVFIFVPFMEFLLPFALKLFPSMLPSTFADEKKDAEKVRKRLKVKLEMAKFLQETIHDSALSTTNKEKSQNLVQEFASFVQQIRSTGGMASKDEILKFSKLFEDELTLDQLPRPQLSALCRLLELNTIGTDNFLRFQLRMKMRQLMSDDKMIAMEGINTLTASELQAACRERGMRALGMAEERLKSQLQQWLDLHLKENVPSALLLLSRAMYLPEHVPVEDQLKVIIATLPETTAEEAKIKIAEFTGDKVENKAKLEHILREEEVIKKEKKEQEEEVAPPTPKIEALDADLVKEVPISEAMQDMAPNLEAKPSEALEPEEQISTKDLEDLESAIENLAEEKHFDIAREELNSLKEDVSEYREDLKILKDVVVAKGEMVGEIKQSIGTKRLSKQLDRMISQMDKYMADLHKEKESLMEDIELKEVRMRRSLQEDEELREEVMKEIKETKNNVISINDLVLSMRRIQKTSDEDRLKKVFQVLDEDEDGIINIDDVLKVVEALGHENIKLTNVQVNNLVRVLRHEMQMEEKEKKKSQEEKEFREQLAKEEAESKETVEGGEEKKKEKESVQL